MSVSTINADATSVSSMLPASCVIGFFTLHTDAKDSSYSTVGNLWLAPTFSLTSPLLQILLKISHIYWVLRYSYPFPYIHALPVEVAICVQIYRLLLNTPHFLLKYTPYKRQYGLYDKFRATHISVRPQQSEFVVQMVSDFTNQSSFDRQWPGPNDDSE